MVLAVLLFQSTKEKPKRTVNFPLKEAGLLEPKKFFEPGSLIKTAQNQRNLPLRLCAQY
jgi:hypothetical protein